MVMWSTGALAVVVMSTVATVVGANCDGGVAPSTSPCNVSRTKCQQSQTENSRVHGEGEWLVAAGRWNGDFRGNTSPSWVVDNNNTTDAVTPFDINEYLVMRLGFRYRSIGESVALTIVYTVILLTGVIGNVVTCAVIVRNSYMHTATNCYLFSLAISDTLALVLGQYVEKRRIVLL